MITTETLNTQDLSILRRAHWITVGLTLFILAVTIICLGGFTYESFEERATSTLGWAIVIGLDLAFLYMIYICCKLSKMLRDNIKSQKKYVLRGRVENFWRQSTSSSPSVPPTWNWTIDNMTITHNPMISGGMRNNNGKPLNVKETQAIQQIGANVEVHLTDDGRPFRFFTI